MDKNKNVADFMNSFLNTPDPKIDNEYYEIEEQYFRQNGSIEIGGDVSGDVHTNMGSITCGNVEGDCHTNMGSISRR